MLTLVTVTGNLQDASGAPLTGTITFLPVAVLSGTTAPVPVSVTDAGALLVIGSAGVTRSISGGTFSMRIAATDNAGLSPEGWGYQVTLTLAGGVPPSSFMCLLPSSPATVDFSGLVPVVLAESLSGSGAVDSVNGQAGVVVLTASEVGADPAGSALSAQSAAESFATSAVAAETTRALAAEALLAPKASPALTGTPTAPTASALTDSTQVATTAYADSAVAAETTRAEAAEALLVPMSDLPLSVARGGTGQISQQAAINSLTGTQSAGKVLRSDGTNATLSAIQAGDVPTLNQNTTGTAAGLSSVLAVSSGGTGSASRSFAGLLTPVSPVTSSASPYSAAAGAFVPVDTTSGNVTVTLPNAPPDLTVVGVKQVIQGGTNTVTVQCQGSDVFNKAGGGTTGTLTLASQGMALQYKASPAIWYVLSDDLPLSQLDARYVAQSSLPLAVASGGTGTATGAPQNDVFAGPSAGGSGAPSFRSLVSADVPTLNQNTTGTAAGLSATLAVASGGTGQASAATAFNALSPLTGSGDTLYGGASGAGTRLAGNTTATKNFYTQTGTGSASAAPAWGTIASADVPTLNQSTTGTAAGLSATLTIASGGTGQTTAAAALAGLGGLVLQSTTGLTGYVLVNGTANILTWTAPSDATIHRVWLTLIMRVTSATTGGNLNIIFTDPSNTSVTQTLLAATQSSGIHGTTTQGYATVPVYPGTTYTLSQASAMTAGAATAWAELWAR